MYINVTDADQLANVFELSAEAPVMLFMYDPYCPINSSAMAEIDELKTTVYLVNVAEHRALGSAVQLYTRVRHESPQLIILRERTPAWHASHGGITALRVGEALEEAS